MLREAENLHNKTLHNKVREFLGRGCFTVKYTGNGLNTVSERTVSNTELSECFGPRRVPGRELSEFLSAFCFCVRPSLRQNSVSSLLRNTTLETVFHPFPRRGPPLASEPPGERFTKPGKCPSFPEITGA